MTITLEEYNKRINEIERNLNFFDKVNFPNNKFTLYLANGDLLNIRISKENIAHLLGVNIDYLRMSHLLKQNTNSYECLKYLIDNSYNFYKLIVEKKLSYDSMFSKDIDLKLESFITNINIRTDDMYCIIKYDNEKTYQAEEIPDICDYYIIRKKENQYYVLGFILKGNISLPVTSRKYENYQDLELFMRRITRKQEITYPYLMKLENDDQMYSNKFFFSLEEKENTLNRIRKLAEQYDATVSVSKDFAFTINRLKATKYNTATNLNVLRLLAESVKNGDVLDITTIPEIYGDDIELEEDVSSLIKICNDTLCSTINNKTATNSYSKLSEENQNLKEELEKLRQQLSNETREKERLQMENQELMGKTNSYSEQLQVYEEAYQKVISLRSKKD